MTLDLHIAPLSEGKARLFFVIDAQAQRADLVEEFRALFAPRGAGGGGADQDGSVPPACVQWMQRAVADYGLSSLRIVSCHRISRYSVWLGCAAEASGPPDAPPSERRVFLAGDAAHSHSPHGGQGANAGLQDGWNLGWKLALASGGGATRLLLESYGWERRPVWGAVVRLADALKRLSGEPHPRGAADALARLVWRLLPDGAQRELLLERMAHMRFCYAWPLAAEVGAGWQRWLEGGGGGRPGALLPPAWVALAGRMCTLHHALWSPDQGGGFRLLLVAPGRSARGAGIAWGALARSHLAALPLLLLLLLVWPVAAAALLGAWVVRSFLLLRAGPSTGQPAGAPPPRWSHYSQLADRLAREPAMRRCGLRASLLLQEGHPAPPPGNAGALQLLVDCEGAAAAVLGCSAGGEALFLVRPDGHILLRAAAVEWAPLARHLARLQAAQV